MRQYLTVNSSFTRFTKNHSNLQNSTELVVSITWVLLENFPRVFQGGSIGSRWRIAVSINCEGRIFRTVSFRRDDFSRRSGSAIMVFLEITSCNHRILRAAANCGLLGRYSRKTWCHATSQTRWLPPPSLIFPSPPPASARRYKIAISWQLSYYAVTEVAENILNLNMKRNTVVCSSNSDSRARDTKNCALPVCSLFLKSSKITQFPKLTQTRDK